MQHGQLFLNLVQQCLISNSPSLNLEFVHFYSVEFEIAKRQVDAIGTLASSENAKTIVIPTDVTAAIGSLSSILEVIKPGKKA